MTMSFSFCNLFVGLIVFHHQTYSFIIPNHERRQPQTTITTNVHRPDTSTSLRSSSDDDNHGNEDEWRAFRARLVQNGLPTFTTDTTTTTNEDEEKPSSNTEQPSSSSSYAYECTPLVEVGTILVSIPTTDLCQGLEQQYWHRSCVLITEVAENVQMGVLESKVPDDQLAQGKNRGRWSYRGILLNRYTDYIMDQEWNIHRGGDLLGLNSSCGQTEFICLHQLPFTDEKIRHISKKLTGNLAMTSLEDAQRLCQGNCDKYTSNDFYAFGGFCSWRPGQLELEMGEPRHEWLALSVDHESIWKGLKNQRDQCNTLRHADENQDALLSHGFVRSGTDMWRNFLSMIDVTESKATERIPKGQNEFYDRMLQVWGDENLIFNNKIDKNDQHSASSSTKEDIVQKESSSNKIGPGTLVRSSPIVTNDMLLYEHEFIRSTVLVLEETPKATVGIVLNHPLAAGIDCVAGKPPITLRYGGPIDILSWKDGTYIENKDGDEIYDDGDENDETYDGFEDFIASMDENDQLDFDFDYEDESYASDDDEDSSFLWIHRDVALGSKGEKNGGGKRLRNDVDVWVIPENDAIEALQTGFLDLNDVMVFDGVCIWEKDEQLGRCGGGLREQVDALKSFEIVQATNDGNDADAIESVWDILSQSQSILVKETLDANMGGTIAAWESCDEPSIRKMTQMTTDRRDLCDAALRAWIGINLLGDPLGTLVEVNANQNG